MQILSLKTPKYFHKIEKSIPKNINLIIKPHPLDESIFQEKN